MTEIETVETGIPEISEERDFEGFKKALLEQYQERCADMKRKADDDLADIITARRMEVERIAHRLQRDAETRLREGLAAGRRYAERYARTRRTALQNEFLERLEKAVAERVAAFRSSQGYREAMNALFTEARQQLPGTTAVLVEKGDAVFLNENGDVPEIREELHDVWGGLVLVGPRLVDNTFRTRWKRLYPVFLEDVRRHMSAFPDPGFPDIFK